MRRLYGLLFRQIEQRIEFVPNGFDEADFREPLQQPQRERPLLVYCGRWSGIAGRSAEFLLRTVREVIDSGHAINLDLIGDDSPSLRRSVRRFGLEGAVRIYGAVPNHEAIRAMRTADILMVYQPQSRNQMTPVASKTFEYLRAGRPILAIVLPGDNADIVRRYAAVHEVIIQENLKDAVAAICRLVRRTHEASASPDPEFVERYSRRYIAQRIAAIFDAILIRENSFMQVSSEPFSYEVTKTQKQEE
jgi:glycosyltransferase involved in cell wall biosynthesis